ASVAIRLAGLCTSALFLSSTSRSSADTWSRFRSLVSANPIDPDTRWIDLTARSSTAAQHRSAVQCTLLIERNRRSTTATRHRRCVDLFFSSAVPDEYDLVIAACHPRRRVIDQDALAAIVRASVVPGKDHIIESRPYRLAVHRGARGLRCGFTSFVGDRDG